MVVVPPARLRFCPETGAIAGQCRTAVALSCCGQSSRVAVANVQPERREGKTEALALESGRGTDGSGPVRGF